MTRNQYLSVALFAATAIASPALAATADQSPGSGHTVILSPLTFINDTDINFGSVVLPVGVSGAVELDPDPTVTSFVTNTGVLPIPASAPPRGLMIGAGTAFSDVTVQTAFPSKLYLNGDTTSLVNLAVSLGVNATPTAPNTYTYSIDSGQAFEVYLGGRVDIPAGTSTAAIRTSTRLPPPIRKDRVGDYGLKRGGAFGRRPPCCHPLKPFASKR